MEDSPPTSPQLPPKMAPKTRSRLLPRPIIQIIQTDLGLLAQITRVTLWIMNTIHIPQSIRNLSIQTGLNRLRPRDLQKTQVSSGLIPIFHLRSLLLIHPNRRPRRPVTSPQSPSLRKILVPLKRQMRVPLPIQLSRKP